MALTWELSGVKENGTLRREKPVPCAGLRMNFLPFTIYLSFAGALLTWIVGTRSAAMARWVALAFAVGGALIALFAAFNFMPAADGEPLTLARASWFSFAKYHLAVDGLSLVLVLLTGVAATAGVLFSWNVAHRTGDFFALFLVLIGGVYGVFLSADAFLFFVFYEIAIVPKYFLIAVWGSDSREYGAMKLVLYSFAGSALVMAGLVWAWAASGGGSFDLTAFIAQTRLLPAEVQTGAFALVFGGFAVLAGMFPFHTWAPTGHVAAPTGASMLLAGVVMKLGAYGCLRVALPAFPEGFANLQSVIAVLAVAGILYAGLAALVQNDFKFVIGYSSVSHMGFVLLGIAAATPLALCGAVLQMFSHGIVAGLLFAVVGRMVYERTHTRDLAELGTWHLARLMPFAAVVFVLAGLASIGAPGFSGFPAEFSILAGTWQHSPLWALLAAVGIPIAAAFTLRVVRAAFFGQPNSDASAGAPIERHLPEPVTLPEKVGAALLIGASVIVGICPGLLIDWIVPALASPLMQISTQGGVR
ncbi:MAG: NADH-quinone oxidoreductase subunit M [Puniceicoccales bacterium]|nr:NADH-quinone oxidoreductase subunit M [Puniceicoccales bacterium]